MAKKKNQEKVVSIHSKKKLTGQEMNGLSTDQLFWEVVYRKYPYEIKSGLREILKVDPEHLGARFELYKFEYPEWGYENLEDINLFAAEAIELWLEEGCPAWNREEPSYSLGIVLNILYFYCEKGLYGLANDLCDIIISHPQEAYHRDFIFILLSVKNQVFDFDYLQNQFENELKNATVQDATAIHFLIASMVRGEFAVAKSVLRLILERYPEYSWIFQTGHWPMVAFEENGLFVISESDTMFNSLVFMQDFLERRRDLVRKVSQMTREIEENREGTIQHFYKFYQLPELLNLQDKRVRIFYENGIHKLEDFKKWTEKELLALDGIGKTSIEHLKDQGIQFKS
ncbi:TPA: hypothetical protein ACGO3U_001341 [Streptococcus suis]